MNSLFTTKQYEQLIQNGTIANHDKDLPPVVMITLPGTACIWLLSELDSDSPNIGFGLCDLGMGFPELGYVDLNEIKGIKHPVFGTGIYVNPLFEGKYPMSAYAGAARANAEIVWDDATVARYARKAPDRLTP